MMNKIKVGVLGATGAVGQRFVQLLEGHPYFELTTLAASDRSAGRFYRDACTWYLGSDMPAYAKDKIVVATDPKQFPNDVKIIFSAMPAEYALEVEAAFAKAGCYVFSKTKTYRMEDDIPLIITEVNHDHLRILEAQKKKRGWSGAIITSPNCSTIGLVMALKPIDDAFGIDTCIVSTMQALSGAGYPGVPSMAILDNVIPYIGGEEEKIETETYKILGTYRDGIITPSSIKVSASCHRVAVIDGHLEDVHLSLKKEASIEDIKKCLSSFTSAAQKLGLPSAPRHPIVVRTENDRPQPRIDRDEGKGMSVVVGRIRKDEVLKNGIKMNVLSHNTIRGAAGASILDAELFVKEMKMI